MASWFYGPLLHLDGRRLFFSVGRWDELKQKNCQQKVPSAATNASGVSSFFDFLLQMSVWAADVLEEIARFVVGCGEDEEASRSRGFDKSWLEDELSTQEHVHYTPSSMRRRDVHYSVEVRSRLQAYYKALASNNYRAVTYSPHLDRLCDRSRSTFLAIGTMRATCRAWRCSVGYDLENVYVHARWAAKCRNGHLVGCRRLLVTGMRDESSPVGGGGRSRLCRQPPEMIRYLPELEAVSFHSMTLETLPWWFRNLNIVDFRIEDEDANHQRLVQGWDKAPETKRQREETTLSKWLSSSPSSHACLPASLVEVDFRGISRHFGRLPPCLRSLTNLRDLWLGHAFNRVLVVPAWFEELKALRRVSVGLAIDVFAPVLRNLSLRAVSIDFTEFELDHYSDYERLDGSLDALLSKNSKCAQSLTELNLCWWWEALTEFPEPIRHCRRLEALNVGNSTISSLPDWLCDANFPSLALLDLAASDLAASPPLHLLVALSNLKVLIVDDRTPEDVVDTFRRSRPQVEVRVFYV